MSVVDNERPPYLTFERRAVEDRNASNAAGHYVSRDVDFVVLTRPGSRDTVEKEVDGWLKDCAAHVKNQRMPGTWLTAFRDAYASWKAGEEIPEKGTPVKGWPVLSPSAQKDLVAAGIRTVEDLAEIPDQDLQGICIGAAQFKAKAKAWLLAAKDTGKLAEQLTSMQQTLESLRLLTETQAAEIQRLNSLLPKEATK